jgi:hypothetical protein
MMWILYAIAWDLRLSRPTIRAAGAIAGVWIMGMLPLGNPDPGLASLDAIAYLDYNSEQYRRQAHINAGRAAV